MSKIWLIIQREYFTRVRRRSFILATLLTPLGFGVFLAVVQLIFGYESDDMRRIVVVDQGDLLEGALADEQNLYFQIGFCSRIVFSSSSRSFVIPNIRATNSER